MFTEVNGTERESFRRSENARRGERKTTEKIKDSLRA